MLLPGSCSACGDLAPPNDSDITTTLGEISSSAGKGCASCALIERTIHDCVPEALLVPNFSNGVEVVIRQAIMRTFVEAVVKWGEHNSVILDLFVEAGMLFLQYLGRCSNLLSPIFWHISTHTLQAFHMSFSQSSC